MTTPDERMQILKMISQKQITAEEGAGLLEALRGARAVSAPGRDEPGKARWLRVRVTDRFSGRTKVNVNLPIGLVDVGLKMGARFAPEMVGLDISAIQAALKNGVQGRIVAMDDEEDDERVEIFVE
jgi:SHOCT-like domain